MITESKKSMYYPKYGVAKRIIKYTFPYGGRKEILEGYIIINVETGIPASELFTNKDDAKTYAYKLEIKQ